MKASTEKKRRDLHFQVRDWVYVKLKPYQHKSLAKRLNEKLSPSYFGPYQVEAHVGQVSYMLIYLFLLQFTLFSMFLCYG